MFVVLLKFSENKSQAPMFMDGHNGWLKQGFSEGIFLLAGSIEVGVGGAIIAHNTSLPELQQRVNQDPFVVENIVTSDIIEISPKKADERLNFLLG